MLEEPYEGNLHVRICGGIGQVTGRFYPEPDAAEGASFLGFERCRKFCLLAN
jgi:hypothetical protein